MDYKELKMVMRGKARRAKGLVNLLKDDTEHMYEEVNVLDTFRLEDTLRDTKQTAQQLLDTIVEIEHYLFIAKQDPTEQ